MALTRITVDTRDLDRGMRELLARLTDEQPSHVDTGIFGEQGEDLLLIALFNEFGTENIPERPYIRSTVDAKAEAWGKLAKSLVRQMHDGDMTKSQALGIMGLQIKSDIQTTIKVLREPPNAPSTIRRKGSDNPLIDTGRLRQSVISKVE